MTRPDPLPASAPVDRPSRAGRNLPAAIGSAIVLLVLIAASLYFWKPAFLLVVVPAICIGIWELKRGFAAEQIRLPYQPVMAGAVVMLVGAYVGGAPALVTALAVTALATMLWRLRGGIAGFVRDTTAGVFTAVYVPFLAGFVLLLLKPEDGPLRVVTFILVTMASDIGGYFVGVLAGRHPMAPVISPKKTWEGFAGSGVACVMAGWATVVYLLGGQWWVGVTLGVVVAVMATMGDLCESVIKRDLGIKDMSSVVPGHGGLMDRLDSLLAAVAPTWLLLFYLVPVS
ncbi:MAG: Phosphatidate cytidylyltransferase [uncultured Nocardioidaceae bacterium]|uniref:Phosphatidate cytidylyltransferase n=1 Tax=uncultured Nocardioidaceae bacterium TaxID=253824 RepID=A0A6J4MEL9_9ACTN|nr:MAG: Phosphatidate cytidylyltransferase [uncultured Nocardioidaceae bacterium]